jgi:hypothetical protein
MKKDAPPPIIRAEIDEEEWAHAIALGVERGAALVRELMATPAIGIIPPRYLSWSSRPDGLLVTTDRARFMVVTEAVEAFCPTLAAMIQPKLRAEPVQGSC